MTKKTKRILFVITGLGMGGAMNKGIDVASGEWINFMNAGDSFFDNYVFNRIFYQSQLKNVDVIYGDIIYWIENKQKTIKAKDTKYFYKGLPFCHQAVFVKTIFQKQNKFDFNYKICSDFNFFYNLYTTNHVFKNSKEIVAIYLADGLSDSKNIQANFEKWKIIGYSKMSYNIYYIFTIIRIYIFNKIKLLIGKKLTNYIKLIKLR